MKNINGLIKTKCNFSELLPLTDCPLGDFNEIFDK